jgi:hypothetical protein
MNNFINVRIYSQVIRNRALGPIALAANRVGVSEHDVIPAFGLFCKYSTQVHIEIVDIWRNWNDDWRVLNRMRMKGSEMRRNDSAAEVYM